MTDIQCLRDAGFGSIPIEHDTKTVEETSFESFLILMIRDLKIMRESTIANLQACEPYSEKDEFIQGLNDLLITVELMQMHLEFTMACLQTESQDEFDEVKKKFSVLQEPYKMLDSKEKIAKLATQIGLATFHDKILLELNRILLKCFKTSKKGVVSMVKSEDNSGLVKIIVKSPTTADARLKVAILHYPFLMTIPQDDIFNLPKSSPVWQDIYKSAVFRKILTQKEIRKSFQMLYYASNISHIIVNSPATSGKNLPDYKAVMKLAKEIFYYGSKFTKAQIQALLYLIDPQAEAAFRAWNMIDIPLATRFISLRLPSIGHDDFIYIPRMFPRITKELILKEYEQGTINKIDPIDPALLMATDLKKNREENLRELFIKSDDKIAVRILSHEPINLAEEVAEKASEILTCPKRARQPNAMDGAIIIHMHGGGFVAMSSGSMRIYTARWCKNLKMVHFSIDHRLAPKNPYPDALDDIWQAYLWILNYSESMLGIKAKKIIFAGDSSGANLAMAITLRIIHAGLQPPHGCVLVYPPLKLDILYHTPSSYSALDNPMLHTSLLKLCIKAYVTDGMDYHKDPFISPIVASDELLEKMPPVRIITGSEDPFQDDNWRMVYRLRKLDRDVKIVVHEHLTHAFMCHQDLKNFKLYIKEACELIQDLVNVEPNATL